MTEPILVVEDEPLVRDLIALNLEHMGYAVIPADSFAAGYRALLLESPALAIVDIMLPDGDGFALTRKARDNGVVCPILMLTARADSADKVRGLDCGADDYLSKPFDVTELLARVRALLRRQAGQKTPPVRYELGRFWVRLDTGQALTNEGELTLSDKELRLFTLFAKQEDRVLSRADILEEVWGMDAFPTDRTVDNFVLRLRKLFEEDSDCPQHFVTLRGRGYSFRRKVG
ncbi:MAG: response regulator transcription factor [Cystobacterineae bacterium]|nr:response regulator transcription factor [Cystobacterineae bacterium]